MTWPTIEEVLEQLANAKAEVKAMTRVRIGDVLKTTYEPRDRAPERVEVVVFAEPDEMNYVQACRAQELHKQDRMIWCLHTDVAKVLRRPVRLGDVLKHDDGTILEPMCEQNVRVYDHNGGAAPGWRHLDGTPIAPPRRAAKVGDVLVATEKHPNYAYCARTHWRNTVKVATLDGIDFDGPIEENDLAPYDEYQHEDGTPIEPPRADIKLIESSGAPWRCFAEMVVASAGHHFAATCKCGYTTVHALGTLDPKEGRCTHSWRFDFAIGMAGAWVCTNCPIVIPERTMQDARGREAAGINERSLARQLFDTDPEVLAHVRSRGDFHIKGSTGRWNTADGRAEVVADPCVYAVKWDFDGKELAKLLKKAWAIGTAGNAEDATAKQREGVEAKGWLRAKLRAEAMTGRADAGTKSEMGCE